MCKKNRFQTKSFSRLQDVLAHTRSRIIKKCINDDVSGNVSTLQSRVLSISTFFLLSDNKLLTHHIYADIIFFYNDLRVLMEKLRCRKNNTKRVDEEEVVSA